MEYVKCSKCGKMKAIPNPCLMICTDCMFAETVKASNRMFAHIARKQMTKDIKGTVYRIFRGQCALCKKKLYDNGLDNGCEIHHITALKDGGTNDYENLILLCPNHHKQADMGVIEKAKLKEECGRAIRRYLRGLKKAAEG